ncbi:glutathione S-transferase D7 [Nasonia vitripennis]|uniref:Uncharacterized protein n=1 Tax=Nasonia vitripennis TaxID=7425 RepID=A0A7M7G2C1_NASVI|nr:glutathione S-transferase D7 [Nasonia vitripennis]
MTVVLYYKPHSPSCRSVMMVAKHLGVQLNLKFISIPQLEQLKPSFLEMNPQHTVPTMDDDGFILWESRVILPYIVSKYGKNDALYPKDLKKRATVDQRLYYDIDVLYKSIVSYFSPVLLGQTEEPPKEQLPALEKALKLLNDFLKNGKYVAGDRSTIADYYIVVNICTLMGFGFEIAQYDQIVAWYNLCKKVMKNDGFEEFNEEQAKVLGRFYLSNLKT